MIADLLGQFVNSPAAQEAVSSVASETGLGAAEAQKAVVATAEGAAEAANDGDLLGNLGSLLGGGGLGSLLGGGGAGIADGIGKSIAKIVAEKTGISETVAMTVVGIVLPKIMEFVQGKDADEGGGLLGGLLG